MSVPLRRLRTRLGQRSVSWHETLDARAIRIAWQGIVAHRIGWNADALSHARARRNALATLRRDVHTMPRDDVALRDADLLWRGTVRAGHGRLALVDRYAGAPAVVHHGRAFPDRALGHRRIAEHIQHVALDPRNALSNHTLNARASHAKGGACILDAWIGAHGGGDLVRPNGDTRAAVREQLAL